MQLETLAISAETRLTPTSTSRMAVGAEKHALRCLGASFANGARQTTLAELERLGRWDRGDETAGPLDGGRTRRSTHFPPASSTKLPLHRSAPLAKRLLICSVRSGSRHRASHRRRCGRAVGTWSRCASRHPLGRPRVSRSRMSVAFRARSFRSQYLIVDRPTPNSMRPFLEWKLLLDEQPLKHLRFDLPLRRMRLRPSRRQPVLLQPVADRRFVLADPLADRFEGHSLCQALF